ncbi:MAG: AbrB/MazE/SpoVT family DNA-binding domain-containing protein [Candidatus Acetothermia bacterium]
MTKVDTTKISSRGQVVIPKRLREDLGLGTGDSLIIVKKGDSLILRKLTLEDIARETDRQLEEGETMSIDEAFEGLV